MADERKYLGIYQNRTDFMSPDGLEMQSGSPWVAVIEEDEYNNGNTTVDYSSNGDGDIESYLGQLNYGQFTINMLIDKLKKEIYLSEENYDKLYLHGPNVDAVDENGFLIGYSWNDPTVTFYVYSEGDYTPITGGTGGGGTDVGVTGDTLGISDDSSYVENGVLYISGSLDNGVLSIESQAGGGNTVNSNEASLEGNTLYLNGDDVEGGIFTVSGNVNGEILYIE